MCVSAPTACITVPIAVKPAMFRWPTPVSTEAQQFQLKIDDDPRLAAAAGGAVRYIADAAGLETREVTDLQAATVAACQEAFDGLLPPHNSVDVTISRFPDRIELALSHFGEGAPAVGLDTIAGFASRLGGPASSPSPLQIFDRVQYETQGSAAVTRLTKYIRSSAPNA